MHTYWVPGVYTVTLDVFGPGGWTTLDKDGYVAVAPDTVPPTGTLTIAGGASVTRSPTVTLSITATDALGMADMCLVNDAGPCTQWSHLPSRASGCCHWRMARTPSYATSAT